MNGHLTSTSVNLMKTLLKSALAAVACAAMLPMGSAMAAPTFMLSGPLSVSPGATFNVDLVASGVTDLYAFQFDLIFNPSLFKVNSVVEGAFLASAGPTFFGGGTIDNTGGEVAFTFSTLTSLVTGASGSGVLASFSVEAIGARNNSGAFSLSNVVALDSTLVSIDIVPGSTAVSIPSPGTLALVLTGLAIPICQRRRQAKIDSVGQSHTGQGHSGQGHSVATSM